MSSNSICKYSLLVVPLR